MAGKAKAALQRIKAKGFIVPTPEQVAAADTTGNGGFTAAQLAEWGVPWPPPHGWRRELERRWYDGQQRSDQKVTPAIARAALRRWN